MLIDCRDFPPDSSLSGEISSIVDWNEEDEIVSNLTCIGLVGIQDPVRPEVRTTVERGGGRREGEGDRRWCDTDQILCSSLSVYRGKGHSASPSLGYFLLAQQIAWSTGQAEQLTPCQWNN